jgi:class III cytochrome C family protein
MTKKSSIILFLLLLMGISGGLVALHPGSPGSPAAHAAAAKETPAPEPPATQWTAPDQVAALERAEETVPFVDVVMEECKLCRQMRLREMGLGTKDIPNSYFVLNSPIINKVEDHYGPVRFMHSKHAAQVKDCALCHHYRPLDANAQETTRCSACHQDAFRKDNPERIGLKAAYHQQCLECHKEMNQGPVDCIGCHTKNVPDHAELVQLSGKPEPTEVTQECLRCHKDAGKDMLTTAHWLLKGPSPYTLGHRKEVEIGKGTIATNNF